MTLGKHQDEAISAPDSARDDDTLDIVRLLIETETRHAKAHPERRGEAHGEGRDDAGASSAAARIAPRRVTLRGQPKDVRGRPVAASDEAPYRAEDLRPSRFGLKWPALERAQADRRHEGTVAAARGHIKNRKGPDIALSEIGGTDGSGPCDIVQALAHSFGAVHAGLAGIDCVFAAWVGTDQRTVGGGLDLVSKQAP